MVTGQPIQRPQPEFQKITTWIWEKKVLSGPANFLWWTSEYVLVLLKLWQGLIKFLNQSCSFGKIIQCISFLIVEFEELKQRRLENVKFAPSCLHSTSWRAPIVYQFFSQSCLKPWNKEFSYKIPSYCQYIWGLKSPPKFYFLICSLFLPLSSFVRWNRSLIYFYFKVSAHLTHSPSMHRKRDQLEETVSTNDVSQYNNCQKNNNSTYLCIESKAHALAMSTPLFGVRISFFFSVN